MKSGKFTSDFDASFKFSGQEFSVGFDVGVSPEMFEDAAEKVVDEAIEQVKSAFADLADNVEKWLLAVKDGLVKGVDNVADVLQNAFDQTPQQIGKAIRDTLGQGSQAAAQALESIGQSGEQIAEILKGLGDNAENVSIALLSLADQTNDTVLAILNTVGFPDNVISGTTLAKNVAAAKAAAEREAKRLAEEAERARKAAAEEAERARKAAAAAEERVRKEAAAAEERARNAAAAAEERARKAAAAELARKKKELKKKQDEIKRAAKRKKEALERKAQKAAEKARKAAHIKVPKHVKVHAKSPW